MKNIMKEISEVFELIRAPVICFLIAIALLMLTQSCRINTSPGTGQKVGKIVRISDQGLFCKTCEAELIRGGLVDGSGSFGGTFRFTIEDEYMKYLAYDAFEKQYEVVITCESSFITSCFRSENREAWFLTHIERCE